MADTCGPALGDAKARARFIYICGADGTGKSTHARLLIGRLRDRGVRCRGLWLRFPFFFSVPLLAYARWRRYSWREVTGAVQHGYWDFQRSWLMRIVFPWVLLVDAALASLYHVYVPLALGVTIVCERYVLDMAVDLAVATGTEFQRRVPGRLLLRLLPRHSRIVLLDLDADAIIGRRHDLASDRRLQARLDIYRQVAAGRRWARVSSADPVSQVASRVWAVVME